MKNILVFSILIILIFFQNTEAKKDKKKDKLKEFRKEIFDCIEGDEKSSNFLKKKIKDYIDEDYEKILRVFISRLSNKDRNIIRKCRKNYFKKVKKLINDKNYTDNLTEKSFNNKTSENVNNIINDKNYTINKIDKSLNNKTSENYNKTKSSTFSSNCTNSSITLQKLNSNSSNDSSFSPSSHHNISSDLNSVASNSISLESNSHSVLSNLTNISSSVSK